MTRRHWTLAWAATVAACGGAESPTASPQAPSSSIPALLVASAAWEAPVPVADAGERPFARCSQFTSSLCRLFNERTAPAVALTGSGQAVALWQRWEGDAFRLVSSRLTPGQGWTEAERVTPDTTATTQRVVVDGRGNALALWSGSQGTATSYGAAAGGWGEAQPIEDFAARLAMEENGTAHLIFERFREGLFWSRLAPGSTWTPPVRLQEQGPTSQPSITDPRLALTRGGVPHALWFRRFQSNVRDEEWDEVWSSRMPPGRAWAPPTLLARFPRAHVFSPTLAATDAGVLASYQLVETVNNRFDHRRVLEQHETGGASPAWTPPAAVSEPLPAPPAMRDAALPVAAADARGTLTLAWTETTYSPSEPDRYEVRARRFSAATGTWEHAQLVASERGFLYERFPLQLAASAAGDAVALWVELDTFGVGFQLWSSVFVPGLGWSASEVLRTTDRLSAPSLAMDDRGNALVLWSEPEGDRTRIWSIRLAAVTVPAR